MASIAHRLATCHRPEASAEVLHTQTASFDDTFECADGDGFVAVHGHDHLPAIGVTPFLTAAFLADHCNAMPAQDTNNFLGVTDWEALAHGSATCSTFAPAGTGTSDGSNQSSSACFALAIASSSVSPAEAHPGSSGKKAAHRLVSGSRSTTNLSFMHLNLTRGVSPGNLGL